MRDFARRLGMPVMFKQGLSGWECFLLQIGCVLLASGFGRRFGSNKLLSLAGGVPLYRRALERLIPLPLARVAVTSQYPQVLDYARALGFLPLENPGAEEGISAGIRLGLSAMEGLDGVLFTVCDQPWLTTNSIVSLLNCFSKSKNAICALAWQGRRGNPVVFPADLFAELAALTGDTGGGAVIRRHPDRLLLVEAASPKELDDVDTPADLNASGGEGVEP